MTVASELEALLLTEPVDVAEVAFAIARIETPHIDPAPARSALARLGDVARDTLEGLGDVPVRERVEALNRLLYRSSGFAGNRTAYDDIRNCLLPEVLERRLGIPITLAVVYISVAQRAGLEVRGVSFPGHFLLRVPGRDNEGPIILDPFDGGRELSDAALRQLLLDQAGRHAQWDDALVAPCTSRQMAVRMLNNMKRLYVSQRSFEQAWSATDVLVAIDPGDLEHIRDRGLLAYHRERYRDALLDLESYVRAGTTAAEEFDQRSQLWEHISALRRRVAGLN